MLVERLAKLAFVGSALRLAGKAGKALATPVASLAKKKPVETAVGGLMLYGGIKGSAHKFRQYQAGFNPQKQQELMGNTPTPGAQ